ncbi:precorrin-3B synthase, partial [Mesorhizobium sp. B1-1-5]
MPDISPTGGEIGRHRGFRQSPTLQTGRRRPRRPISPLVGEMSGRTEGGAKE